MSVLVSVSIQLYKLSKRISSVFDPSPAPSYVDPQNCSPELPSILLSPSTVGTHHSKRKGPRVQFSAEVIARPKHARKPSYQALTYPSSRAIHFSRSYHRTYSESDDDPPLLQDMMYGSIMQMLLPDTCAVIPPQPSSHIRLPLHPLAHTESDDGSAAGVGHSALKLARASRLQQLADERASHASLATAITSADRERAALPPSPTMDLAFLAKDGMPPPSASALTGTCDFEVSVLVRSVSKPEKNAWARPGGAERLGRARAGSV